ncbi:MULTISPECIES: hypothetical protein [Halomonadaceae]|uniref:hypothetical protein n=1 Tax=Halomonadaceae TaxID=28256 RepID=UPI0015999201|nr:MULTISPECIES: hypothetical protein [Halomonas]QJQ95855.1 hypothetical protein HIO72_11625 [Halomonas sp. PA5]
MQRYANPSGSSGIQGYEIGGDTIRIRFGDGSVYRYSYASAGMDNIERMKTLARKGQGLNTFINTTVREEYAERER